MLPPVISHKQRFKGPSPRALILRFCYTLLLSAPLAANAAGETGGYTATAASGESLGNLAQYPPERLILTITTSETGQPILTPQSLELNSECYT